VTGGRDRPNPDHLLQQVQAEERRRGRGRLKVFLGYAAGVGKTYAMLEAARQRLAEGAGVLAAYVETHGRAETEVLLDGIEVAAPRDIAYRGTHLRELDVDGILERHPQLALVDELAHTNAPGSRHPKRHQDVEELLAAGIDVYTTLNVQHLESENDVVAQITGVVVRETVPDRVLDEADEIELVDLPTDELLRRLHEGKVYVPEQAARAVERFFRKGNLTALREVALRCAARRVDQQMRAYMQVQSIPGPWPAAQRLLVCVSPSPLNERIVRTTRRLADELRAEWFALYVETSGQRRLSPQDQERVARHLQLAEDLGAKVATRQADRVADAVVAFARDHNVTRIIAGKSCRPRWVELLRGSLVDQIARGSGAIDVYLSGGEPQPRPRSRERDRRADVAWGQYVLSTLLVAAATVLGWPARLSIEPTNQVILYLTAVVVAALRLGRGPAVWASFLGVAAFDFFYVPPHLTLAVGDTQYLLTFLGLLVVGLVISTLAARLRDQVDAGRLREARTSALYALSRDLASAAELDAVLRAIIDQVSLTFGRSAAVLLPEGESVAVAAASPGLALEQDEVAVACWAYRHGQPAGEGTATLPSAAMRYLPLRTARGVLGVLGVAPSASDERLDPERRHLLDAFASQAALAIERAELADEAGQVELLRATERLHTALLNSISHELRTPLATITGVLSSLRGTGGRPGALSALDDASRAELIETAWGQTGRLNRLVGNLLDMTRLEAGALHVAPEPCELEDVVGTVLSQMAEQWPEREVTVSIPSGLPLLRADFVLVGQALANVLDNAAKYSPDGTKVEVSARAVPEGVEVSVADRGVGLAHADLSRIFEKFYRVRRPEGVTGTGLGLSISKGIVEAHGGTIAAEQRPGGGTVIRLVLPCVAAEADREEVAP
jgi:two-component system, OmpR family, sensor histidine kinase KdpD